MAIITLLSDWGHSDHYVASVKAAILSKMPEVNIVDISHDIRPFDIKHAAFVMNNVWRNFPSGTVHILGMDTVESDNHVHVAVLCEGHFFIGADTGLLSLLFSTQPEQVIVLEIFQDTKYFTFAERDRFAKAAVHLAKGNPLSELGTAKNDLVFKTLLQPTFSNGIVYGKVTHIDVYHNVFVNIAETFVQQYFGTKKVFVQFKKLQIPIVKAYADVLEGMPCALYASNGFLQIAVNRGKASTLLGLYMDDEVLVIKGDEPQELF